MLLNTGHGIGGSIHVYPLHIISFRPSKNILIETWSLLIVILKDYVSTFRKPHPSALWMLTLCMSVISFHENVLCVLSRSHWTSIS